MRASRMQRGGMGIESSSSLSFASNSCDFAVKTLPMNISAKAMMAYIAQ